MEGSIGKLCRLSVALVALTGLWSCGSTPDNDALVLDLLEFSDDGITQCDTVSADLAEVDVIRDLCMEGGGDPTDEPFTETSANVSFRNNQKLDITIDSYTVKIIDSGVGVATRLTSQTVIGRRCANESSRPCAVVNDCVIGGTAGQCLASTTSVQVLLADFTTKALIIPSVEPGGKTLDMQITFFGSDVTGADWQATGFLSGTFTDFNNCNCSLSQ